MDEQNGELGTSIPPAGPGPEGSRAGCILSSLPKHSQIPYAKTSSGRGLLVACPQLPLVPVVDSSSVPF